MGADSMELGGGSTSSPGIDVPRRGLARIESEWSGRGQLLSSASGLESERQWTEEDVRRRINRILFEVCSSPCSQASVVSTPMERSTSSRDTWFIERDQPYLSVGLISFGPDCVAGPLVHTMYDTESGYQRASMQQ